MQHIFYCCAATYPSLALAIVAACAASIGLLADVGCYGRACLCAPRYVCSFTSVFCPRVPGWQVSDRYNVRGNNGPEFRRANQPLLHGRVVEPQNVRCCVSRCKAKRYRYTVADVGRPGFGVTVWLQVLKNSLQKHFSPDRSPLKHSSSAARAFAPSPERQKAHRKRPPCLQTAAVHSN